MTHKKLPVILDHIKNKTWKVSIQRFDFFYDKHKTNHWFMFQYARALYKIDNPTASLIALEAIKLAPNCPECVLHASNILFKSHDSIELLNQFIKNDQITIMNNQCCEGIGWARSVHNDCLFVAAKYYHHHGNDDSARRYIDLHISGRTRGRKSAFDRKEIEELKRNLTDKLIDGSEYFRY
jgi:hypothetical protein